jgi:hypothetical protein
MTVETRSPRSLRRQIRPLFSPLSPLRDAISFISSSRAEASRVECTDWYNFLFDSHPIPAAQYNTNAVNASSRRMTTIETYVKIRAALLGGRNRGHTKSNHVEQMSGTDDVTHVSIPNGKARYATQNPSLPIMCAVRVK